MWVPNYILTALGVIKERSYSEFIHRKLLTCQLLETCRTHARRNPPVVTQRSYPSQFFKCVPSYLGHPMDSFASGILERCGNDGTIWDFSQEVSSRIFWALRSIYQYQIDIKTTNGY
jgi:hypothetical protein